MLTAEERQAADLAASDILAQSRRPELIGPMLLLAHVPGLIVLARFYADHCTLEQRLTEALARIKELEGR